VHSVLLGDRFRVVNRERELFNTMAYLDAQAATFPKARSWLNYPYFMFARYPHLRPSNNGRAFWQKLEEWENRIESDSKAARALEDLKPDLRKQLAALLVDIIAELQMYKKKISRPPKTFLAETERRKRMLVRKREKARRELESLRGYARGLDRLLAGDDEEAARRCLEILAGIGDYDHAAILKALEGAHPVPEDPTVRGMVDLYWFFRHGCKITGDEAEVRVALLRNAFWTRYGVAGVDYRPAYVAGESKGCQAVHEAIRRFRPPRGTSQ
jgi:hypothetical protein